MSLVIIMKASMIRTRILTGLLCTLILSTPHFTHSLQPSTAIVQSAQEKRTALMTLALLTLCFTAIGAAATDSCWKMIECPEKNKAAIGGCFAFAMACASCFVRKIVPRIPIQPASTPSITNV